MQVCTLLQTDNHASTPPLSFLQAGCPSCRPTNSIEALKAQNHTDNKIHLTFKFYAVNKTFVANAAHFVHITCKAHENTNCSAIN